MTTTIDDRPGVARSGRIPQRTVLLVASFGAFLAFLDATIVNVAFPNIRESFPDSTISSLSWILNAYSIVFAAFLVVSGRLADLLGRRWAFTTGVLVFTVASALCAASGSVGILVVARVIQALGAAILVPASLALVVEAFPLAKRSHAVGLWGASAALASGLGPPIGGALVEAGGWRWAFLVNIPFGIAALVAGRKLLVESRAPGRRRMPDLLGATVSALGLGLLTLGLVKGSDWGWTSPAVLACFGGAAVLFALFVLSSRRHRSPLIDPTLLRIRSFAVGNVATIVAGMGFYAYLLTNILWLQYVWRYSILESGLAVVPGALIAAVLAAVLGPVAQRRGYRLVIIPGAIIWALAYVWYATRVEVTPDFLGTWLPGQILSGIGVGATLPVLGSAALAAVPGGRFATASAVNSSARQIGAVLGISILVIIVGTPTAIAPAEIVGSLRHGWVFSAICFALTAGRLDVVAGGVVLRQLGAGAVIGELALLTGGTRSASIRARRDSHLLRVTHDSFASAIGSDPAALSALTTVLAEQLSDGHANGAAPARSPQPRLIAIVALGVGAPVAEVADEIATVLNPKLRVAIPGRVGPDGLERAERDHDRVLLVAEDPDDEWWTMCVRQADHLVLVAAADQTPPAGPPLGRIDADLVLVGRPRPGRDLVRAWTEAVAPWQIAMSDGLDLREVLRPLGTRLAGRSVGVVLAGGGARAFAHIGVLHELEDAGITVDRVAGSSLGALIGALYAAGMDAGEVEDACYREFVRGRPFHDYTFPLVSVAKGRRTEKLLRRYLGDALIEELPRQFRCSSTDLASRTAHDHRHGPLVDAVMASIALPVLFPPRRDGQRLLADGGILDNLPVRLLTERDEGPLLAVNIGMGGGSGPRSDGPGAAIALRPVRIPALGETLMRSMFIGSGGGVDTALSAGAVVLTPSSHGVGLLEFHQLDAMVAAGREAGRALLDQADAHLR